MYDAKSVEVLDKGECEKYLRESLIGRVVFVDSLLLAAHPVRYVVEGHCILFRTDHGAKLRAADRHKMLAFEIDDIDPITGHGWSVVASGFAEHVTDPCEVERLTEIVPIPWAPTDRTDVIRLFVDLYQGRRYNE
ncbi:pyridoxamine 5'-phosphate oxidase family protein [Actinopolymorpha rutila]|uniref:Nitroimidazol reductase NimA-like FMN-containing flavoprotein (Pyridoxamine 5'-phosphate oxidase superfamily) n=1 Tax=Actinopolymorpha rutila TaxID=446787 RepID=A0A852ZPW6_9ACTN|nr:pyridoxamine 5'-phosphate oxidase family protein [Actinopolymorpha rutila]NYH93572.1 nitroimidazol reductase NimA-like FMN-containing flavoprotein (pyridoxamine 5'-phosphate oxidase superfamily) [Actinopolymorpha rutila]